MKKSFSLIVISFLSICTTFSQVDHWEILVNYSDQWKYFEGVSEPPANWSANGFDASSWSQGSGGLGFGDNDDATIVNQELSLYCRREFSLTQLSDIESAYLCIDYDDAFVAYLNGIEIARSGLAGTPPAYNELASSSREALLYQGGKREYFKINKDFLSSILVSGTNVLAVQVHNRSNSSNDLSMIADFVVGIKTATIQYGASPAWLEIIEVKLDSTNLPIVIIETEGGATIPWHEDYDDPKIKASLKIIDNGTLNKQSDTANIYNGNIGIEIRGNSSAEFPQKPFAIETRDNLEQNLNVPMWDMPKENDWILISNFGDNSLLRNTLTLHLFNKMGHYASRTKHCEVMLNDEYMGLYIFAEKIKRDKGRVDISNLKETDIAGDELTGGYIFKVDETTENDYWTSKISRSYLINDVNFIYHDPRADELVDVQKQYLENYIDAFESALFGENFADPVLGYAPYINTRSFIDYYLINELCRNIDAYKKSKYYYKMKDSNGGLIYSGPVWDFDWAWRYVSFNNGSGWASGVYSSMNPAPDLWIIQLLNDPIFSNQVYYRYKELRSTIFNKTYLYNYIDSVTNLVDVAKERHFKKWGTLENNYTEVVETKPWATSYTEEISRIKTFINERLAFLDSEFEDFYTPGLSAGNYQTVSAKVFPNPAQDYIFIENDKIVKQVSIYNRQGVLVWQQSCNDKYTIQADIATLSSGLYLINVETEIGNETCKFMKQ